MGIYVTTTVCTVVQNDKDIQPCVIILIYF